MRVLLLVALASAVSSCDIGHLVYPDDAVRLGTTDGLLALDVEAPGVVRLTLCRNGDYGACLSTGPMTTDGAVQLYVAPAGAYCVLEIDFEPNADERVRRQVATEDSACFEVHPSVISDPGTFVLDARAIEGTRWRFDPRWQPRAGIAARIAAQYPDLAAMTVVPTDFVSYRRLHPQPSR